MTREGALSRLKQTVAYYESDNKEEFLKGADMMFDNYHQWVTSDIPVILESMEIYRELSETYLSDLKTISSLILKYGENNV